MGEPVLIFTGGTLCMRKPEKKGGLIKPSQDALLQCAKKVGFDLSKVENPYTIDSIDFNIGLNYPSLQVKHEDYGKLLETVEDVLAHGDTPVICGGTDSKPWYSALLVRDIMRQKKFLQPQSGEKIVFLSSMKSIEEEPKLVEETLRAGREFALEKNVSGGFALSAENTSGTVFTVHDVTNQFDKISSVLHDAFRSRHVVGHIHQRIFSSSRYTPPEFEDSKPDNYAHIAPPLLAKQNSEVVLAYLKAMEEAYPPFDGVMIEGLPSIQEKTLRPDDKDALVAAVKALKKKHIEVVICNPVRFNTTKEIGGRVNAMRPVYNDLGTSSELAEDLATAGAKFVVGLPKDVYLDMMLTIPHRESPGEQPEHQKTVARRMQRMRIRYVPDVATMTAAIENLSPYAENIVFSALPNAALPDALIGTVKKNMQTHNTRFFRTFEYKGEQYIDNGTRHEETTAHRRYHAGDEIAKIVREEEVLDRELAERGADGRARA